MKNNRPEWRIILETLEKLDIVLLNRIVRRMIYYLYKFNIKEIPELIMNIEPAKTFEKAENSSDRIYSNMPNPKINTRSLRQFTDKVFQIAADNIKDEEISEQIKIWLSQERSRFLSIAFEDSNISLVEAKDVLGRFMNIPKGELYMSPDDFVNIRVLLIRRFLSSNLNYINVAKHYILIKDFNRIVLNMIGPASGTGKLGGKSAGLILGYEIIESEKNKFKELKDIKVPKSWYITTDTIMDFVHFNALEEITSLKYLDTEEIRAGYSYLQQLFKNSFFPREIIEQLENLLKSIGDKPIIVRSSSLLEDSFDAAFSGKYKSLFLANTGSEDEKLSALLDAIAEIYASIFGPDPIEYRKEKGLIDFQEKMGVLIQEVVGNRIGKYFFPTFAGVAFSNNEFRWSPRIKREDGVVRIVAGLGTRAVDRIGDDYPFLASPGQPGLRVNISYEDKIKYSQKKIDVLNLESNEFETIDSEDILKQYGNEIPGMEQIISIDSGDHLSPPVGVLWDLKKSDFSITFQNLTDNRDFLKKVKKMLDVLTEAFKCPVDIEFASDGKNLFILQCRPQIKSESSDFVSIPDNLEEENIIIRSEKFITSGSVRDIKYIVYVIPEEYNSLKNETDMKSVANVISLLNKKLGKKNFILIGPGRWGSRGDIKLGVPVTYSNIFNTAMLIELSYHKEGYIPELSFGTHFFQDLVESNIKYLPLYPDESGSLFKREAFDKVPNRLADLISVNPVMEKTVKVIDTDDLKNGSLLSILMDENINKAIGFLE